MQEKWKNANFGGEENGIKMKKSTAQDEQREYERAIQLPWKRRKRNARGVSSGVGDRKRDLICLDPTRNILLRLQ